MAFTALSLDSPTPSCVLLGFHVAFTETWFKTTTRTITATQTLLFTALLHFTILLLLCLVVLYFECLTSLVIGLLLPTVLGVPCWCSYLLGSTWKYEIHAHAAAYSVQDCGPLIEIFFVVLCGPDAGAVQYNARRCAR